MSTITVRIIASRDNTVVSIENGKGSKTAIEGILPVLIRIHAIKTIAFIVKNKTLPKRDVKSSANLTAKERFSRAFASKLFIKCLLTSWVGLDMGYAISILYIGNK